MILNDEQLAMIFDEKETGYVSMTKESLESLRETFADLKRQLKEWDAWVEEFIPCAKHGLSRCRECHSHVALDAYVQERVDRAVLNHTIEARRLFVGTSAKNFLYWLDKRIATNRAKVEKKRI